MAKIVQALTLLSLVSRAFAVTAYLYDVIQCPSNDYISTVCSNLPQLSCCTHYYGVRSVCFLHFIYIWLPDYNSIISRAQYSSMSETTTLSWEPTATVMAPCALRQNQQSVQSVFGHFRASSLAYIGHPHPVQMPSTAHTWWFLKHAAPVSTPIFITSLYQANSGSHTPSVSQGNLINLRLLTGRHVLSRRTNSMPSKRLLRSMEAVSTNYKWLLFPGCECEFCLHTKP